MSICYLFAPLNTQLGSVIHTISHSLEMPSNILSHSSNEHLKTEIHTNHDHKRVVISHNHTIIEIIDSIVNESNEKDNSNKKHKSELKVKKHLSTNTSKLPLNITRKKLVKFYPISQIISPVHLYKQTQPPISV